MQVVTGTADVLLAAIATHGTIIWLAAGDGDEQLARELGLRLARDPGLAELELLYGSWDPPGARLLDAVTVMDRLMHPDAGDPWKRAQTHATLAPFLLEEAYELFDAIRDDDLGAVREELGDVLLQVVLHARLAEETANFTVDDVAGDLVAKLIRRNPHVFADTEVGGIDEIIANWEQIKKTEKSRTSTVDGVALSQPALALAAKLLQRVTRAGLTVPPPAGRHPRRRALRARHPRPRGGPGRGGRAASHRPGVRRHGPRRRAHAAQVAPDTRRPGLDIRATTAGWTRPIPKLN